MTTSTLGEMLRQKIDRDADIVARKKKQALDDEAAKLERENRYIAMFFEDEKTQFERDILAGRVLTPIKVGGGSNVEIAALLCTYATKQVTSTTHRFHKYWADFENWANANGLTPTWTYEHDGMGRDSWYMLCVSPA